jgi:hypothetical protein
MIVVVVVVDVVAGGFDEGTDAA